MIKEVKKERTAACAYYLSGLDPVDGKKMPISIEKRGDRITIILKGNVHVKNLQQEIINEILRPQKDKVIKKLFNDVYEVIFKENLFSGIDDIMSQIRERNIITHHAYKPQGGEVTLYNLTDKVMIKLVGNPGKDQIKKLLAKYALRRRYTSVSLNNSGSTIIVEVTSQSGADNASGINPPKGKNPLKIANLLEKEKIVDTAEVSLIYRLPNFLEKKMPGKKEKEENINIIKKEKGIDIAVESNGKKKIKSRGIDEKTSTFIPKDTFFNKQWYLHFHDKQDPKGNPIAEDANVNAVKAWEILNGGGDNEIVIAIIDTSIDHNHPDLKNQLAENIETIKKKFVFTSSDVEITDAVLNAGDSHGTKCAGIALAAKNGKGIAGIAYGCKFLPVWLDPNGGEDLMIRCFGEVGKIAHVISFSRAPLPEKMSGVLLTRKLTEIAKSGGPAGRGCVICVSAGNFQVPINGTVKNEGFEFHLDNGDVQKIDKGETIINLYASNPDVIAVTASTSTSTFAAYNNFGTEVSVCAPSADWDPSEGMTNLKAGICTTASLDGNLEDDGGTYSDSFGGTSAAAPLVAGIAALVLSANKKLPAAIVKKILEVTADKIDRNNSGKAKYDNKGHSPFYGYGKVNAAKAVELAISLKNKNDTGKSVSIEEYAQQIKELMKDNTYELNLL